MVPDAQVLAVSGGITSVGDAITVGFNCDAQVVHDPDIFVQGVEKGLGQLVKRRGRRSPRKSGQARRKTNRR